LGLAFGRGSRWCCSRGRSGSKISGATPPNLCHRPAGLGIVNNNPVPRLTIRTIRSLQSNLQTLFDN
jgi:hypothetical protein